MQEIITNSDFQDQKFPDKNGRWTKPMAVSIQ